jgi:hypothetical protein
VLLHQRQRSALARVERFEQLRNCRRIEHGLR